MELVPQRRRWTWAHRLLKVAGVMFGLYVVGTVLFFAYIVVAFSFGGQFG